MRGMVKRPRRHPVLRVPTEHEEQRAFVMLFRQRFPGVRIFAIPNGGARSIVAASKLKAEGVSRGVPDLCIPAWGTWVEMKRTKGGRVDEEQADWHDYLRQHGYTVLVAKGCEDAMKQVEGVKR